MNYIHLIPSFLIWYHENFTGLIFTEKIESEIFVFLPIVTKSKFEDT